MMCSLGLYWHSCWRCCTACVDLCIGACNYHYGWIGLFFFSWHCWAVLC